MTHTLDAATFWKLTALAERTAHRATVAAAARETLLKAQREQNIFVADLAVTLGFDPSVEGFALDDEALTLTIPEGRSAHDVPISDH
jgi:hypothetical protein